MRNFLRRGATPTLHEREREALAPLLDLAHAQSDAERRAWLEDLRTDAPTVVARLELLLIDSNALPFAVTKPQIASSTPSSKRSWILRLNWIRT